MKLQYYLRGLGIGIIVTALVMGFAKGKSEPLTEAEIRALALEIGMVDSNSLKLTDTQATGNPGMPSGDANLSEEGNEEVPESKENDPETEEPSGDGNPPEAGNEEAPESKENDPETGEPSGDGNPPEAGNEEAPESKENDPETGTVSGGENTENGVTVEIEPGTGSGAVSRMLEEAGLIEDAVSFDRYLIDNGYSKRIRMGTYVIIPGTDQEEIARIITRDR